MSNQVFYTLYRFFQGMHGPGDAAEVAALVTWSLLLIFNVGTVAILLIVAMGNPPVLRSYILNIFAASGVVISITQYLRYLGRNRIETLCGMFRGEAPRERNRRRWIALGYSILTLLLFVASLWVASGLSVQTR